MKTNETRPLTAEEIAAFPGDASVDVAMLGTDGIWYYADSGQGQTETGQTVDETMFVTDEDGDYIPVKTN